MIGPLTNAALTQYQRSAGLPEDPKLTEALVEHLRSDFRSQRSARPKSVSH
jgi:hypothetical protein